MPPGHPEAFIEAFTNIYSEVGVSIRRGRGDASGAPADFPTVYDGARGVFFIERTVESANTDKKWTPARWRLSSDDIPESPYTGERAT